MPDIFILVISVVKKVGGFAFEVQLSITEKG